MRMQEQLHHLQQVEAWPQGLLLITPLQQHSKMTPQAHALTSKQSYCSLTSVECKALQFPPRQGKLLAFVAALANGFHSRQINIFTDCQIRIPKISISIYPDITSFFLHCLIQSKMWLFPPILTFNTNHHTCFVPINTHLNFTLLSNEFTTCFPSA